MKKFFKYFTLTFLLLLGLGCVGLLYLFFVPNSTLFGICYISLNENHISEKYDAQNISSISISSSNYDVKIVESEDDEILLKVHSKSIGFVKTKNKVTIIEEELTSNKLTFSITEPHGFAFKNSSYIELTIPEKKTINLSLENNKANTTIDSENIKINTLNYKTQNGDLKIENVEILNNLDLELNKSTITISSSVKTNNNNVKLSLTSGKFNAPDHTFNNISILENERGVIIFNECARIDLDKDSAGGRIEANTVGYANIKSTSTNIYITTITDGTTLTLSNGNVHIENLTGNSSIKTEGGEVTIANLNSYSNIVTKSGNINISSANDVVDISSEYGNVSVNFATNATNKYLTAVLKNGKIVANGLNKINLTITGNARAEIELADVKNNSIIKGNSGSVFVKINKSSKYKLTTQSQSSVRVNLAQIPNYGGYTTTEQTITYVNCYESNYTNSLDVSTTTGSLTILDSNFT